MITRGHKDMIKCRVKDPEKWREMAAVIYGEYLAVHRPLDGFYGYTITHIPTGYSLRSFGNLQTARTIAIKLANSDVPWGELTVENIRGEIGQRAGAALRKAIEEICK